MTPTITLNKGQEQAVKDLYTFLFSDNLAVILTGAAGTGKSFLINYLIDTIIPQYEFDAKLVGKDVLYTTVETSATTRKAAAVIGAATSTMTNTAHGLFNLVLLNDFSTGKVRTIKSKNWKVITNSIIIIDEYTYLNKDTFKIIIDSVDMATCKIIFVGDKDQLMPVGESFCVVDTQGYKVIELTEPVRNSEVPELIQLCNQYRDTVNSGTFWDTLIVPGVVDYLTVEEAEADIVSTMLNQTHNNKILAYRNNTVIAYNHFLRSSKGLHGIFKVGERLLLNNSIKTFLPDTGKSIMVGGESIVEVLEVIENPKDLIFTMKDNKGNEIASLNYYIVKVSFKGMEFKLNVPYSNDDREAAIKVVSRQKSWVDYFHLKEQFADLRPLECSTVHKSQGSTFDTVYIDIEDITQCNFKDMLARMLYVAVSRAKYRVVFFGTPKEGFGSFLTHEEMEVANGS